VNIRGVNVYPTTIEAVVRGFGEITEFRSTVSRAGALRSLSLEIEIAPSVDSAATIRRVSQLLRDALGLTVAVHLAPPGTLPRFEMKARRFVVEE
jgi:phenylacetate-CoA ligase